MNLNYKKDGSLAKPSRNAEIIKKDKVFMQAIYKRLNQQTLVQVAKMVSTLVGDFISPHTLRNWEVRGIADKHRKRLYENFRMDWDEAYKGLTPEQTYTKMRK